MPQGAPSPQPRTSDPCRPIFFVNLPIGAVVVALLGVTLAADGGHIPAGWIVTGLGVVGAGNSMILTAYLGATLAAVRPGQAGAASGTLNTIQQFAGSAGLAAIGAVFFAVLGAHPTAGRYARSAETALWIGLGLIGVMAALTALVRHRDTSIGEAHGKPERQDTDLDDCLSRGPGRPGRDTRDAPPEGPVIVAFGDSITRGDGTTADHDERYPRPSAAQAGLGRPRRRRRSERGHRRQPAAPAQVTGYAVALPGDTGKDSGPVWYGGGKLAADLTEAAPAVDRPGLHR
jgi:hypothetical protein